MIEEINASFKCPDCGEEMDTATGFRNDKIKHDDFTICGKCACLCNWVIAENKYSLRKSTAKDIDLAKEEGLYGEIEELIDFVKGRSSKIIRPKN